ncbi:MAG: homocitrate synthase [Candidatus Aenigmarchaeota archaeon]|nr:homocitrate synthase [Candidatus Aenigmarchaeota archaeon]
MIKEVKLFMADKPRIYLIDVFNRDGVQAHGVQPADIERTMLNYYDDEMGIYQSEFGFPAFKDYNFDYPTNPHFEKKYILANLALKKAGYLPNIKLGGWVRAVVEDVEIARERFEDLEHLNLSISTSDVMLKKKLRKSKHEIIKMMYDAVKKADELRFKTIGVNAEDASRTRHYRNQSYLEEFALAAKEAGADRIRYCDTLGCDRTRSIYKRFRQLAEKVKLPIELHCHNDTGYAVANSIEGAMGALDAGVDAYINTTPNGYGERAGNADLVSVLLTLKFSSGLRKKDILDPNIDLKMAWKICNYASDATGIPIHPNQPGVGSNAFSHESGTHADGMIKDRKNYELFGPRVLGIPTKEKRETGRRIFVGDYSGKSAVDYVLKKYGIICRNIEETTNLIQRAKHSKKKAEFTEDELRLIAEYPDQVRLML